MIARRRALAVVGVAVFGLGLAGCADEAAAPGEAAEQRRETASQLAKAAEAQGICYGWRLDGSGGAPTSRGSSLGDAVPVDSDPGRCPRWMEVNATVRYVSESSEADDSAFVDVRTSADLRVGPTVATKLDRFGLEDKTFVDDPEFAISRAALALPLLAAENGAAPPAVPPATPAASAPRALPDAGSDFWRDRWGFIAVAIGLVALAALFAVVGVVLQRRQRAARSVGARSANKAGSAGTPPPAAPPSSPPPSEAPPAPPSSPPPSGAPPAPPK
jgi:hypothetical protein